MGLMEKVWEISDLVKSNDFIKARKKMKKLYLHLTKMEMNLIITSGGSSQCIFINKGIKGEKKHTVELKMNNVVDLREAFNFT
jgi:hypothetical protein